LRRFKRRDIDASFSITERTIMTTKGKIALITGSTDGVGRYVAERLAAEGWRTIIHGRDRARGEAVIERITQQGGEARFLAADLSSLAEFALSPTRYGAIATVSTRSSTTPGSAQAAHGANLAPTASNCGSRSIISRDSC
jgi:NAD(P)-dependent dehydrogenase (short-subunit alcohol dehydrogenase family)